MELKGRHTDAERYRQMAKLLIGNNEDKKLSNEISAPYEVPQYPIEQIETKLIRLVTLNYVSYTFANDGVAGII